MTWLPENLGVGAKEFSHHLTLLNFIPQGEVPTCAVGLETPLEAFSDIYRSLGAEDSLGSARKADDVQPPKHSRSS